MKAENYIKIAGVGVLTLVVTVVITFLATLDRPLGEGYKQAKDYGGDFTMQSDKGPVSLSDLKDKVVVIYFGFMNCKEACPVSVAKMRTAMKRLNDQEKAQVQGLFVSVDPERDNPKDLNAYIRNYHPSFIGLSDTEAVTDKVLKQYGVFSDLADYENGSVTYTVDHSSRFYMIDKNGKLLTTMSHSTTPAELVAKIRTML